ncbi:RsmB/NOP family class I SAM-dependent RNA methyltransferase [Desulfonatronum thioautotrophicum]|uniref:RsmB/NOP family class I SAM-dependent RNA methyltransferase n=1 Tax=Desulfonatronum thioautotrophicum TaxID=617001 RepID=UPI0005EB99B9|nr:RsmB/NOP family class I SAM-dependent RNA methyltransferase [Desulfonatronum thioautotrophicum]
MPRSFRLVCEPEHVGLVEALLRAEGHVFTPEPFHPLARQLLEEPTPLGASMAAAFGLIYIQDRSSMLAPLLLQPPRGGVVLDMCASPGSKTGLLAQLVGSTGMVLANEPNPRRLATLRQNLAVLNLAQVVTCGHPGQELPLSEAWFSHIQLDPPCSGWGTVERNPRVREMWPEHKLGPLITLQRNLLRKAAALLAPGGSLLYSTCTTNPGENREQIQWAIEELGLATAQLPSLPGFDQSRSQDESIDASSHGWLQIRTEAGEGQGFFYAMLTSPGPSKNTHLEVDQVGSKQHVVATQKKAGPIQYPQARGSRKRRGENAGECGDTPGIVIDPQTCPGPRGAAWERLPPGEVRDFGGRVIFLPEPALSRGRGLALPLRLGWQGIELGRMGGGVLRLHPRMRLLLPEYVPGRGVHLDDVSDLQRLMQGQSLALPSGATAGLQCAKGATGAGVGGRIGLYWRGLPLGWVTLKGRRYLWSAK